MTVTTTRQEWQDTICMYVWTDGWIGRWVHECVDVWMCRCMYARMHVFLTLCIGFKGACMNVCKQVSKQASKQISKQAREQVWFHQVCE